MYTDVYKFAWPMCMRAPFDFEKTLYASDMDTNLVRYCLLLINILIVYHCLAHFKIYALRIFITTV